MLLGELPVGLLLVGLLLVDLLEMESIEPKSLPSLYQFQYQTVDLGSKHLISQV
jgi:hypothetical protein